jgi:hypothetical protein
MVINAPFTPLSSTTLGVMGFPLRKAMPREDIELGHLQNGEKNQPALVFLEGIWPHLKYWK